MIDLTTISKIFETGLNNALHAVTGNEELSFKIWATAGEMDEPQRNGNVIQEFITGNLRVSSTSNSANLLVMGVSGLTLDFVLPVSRPRTNVQQTESELQKVKAGQIQFINGIITIIDNYFQSASTITVIDDISGKTFTVGISAGTAVSGDIDLTSRLGNHVPITTYIEFIYAEDGINAKDIVITISGNKLPFNSVKIDRAGVTERNVYAGQLIAKNITTSTALAIDVEFPAFTRDPAQSAVDYLLNGAPNVAYFTNVNWGKDDNHLYLMAFNSCSGSAQGVLCAGLGASLIEVLDNVEALEFPQTYQVGRFGLSDGQSATLTFTTNSDCTAFICGKAFEMTAGEQTVTLNPSDFEYSEDDDVYYIYLVTDKAVTITSPSAEFTVIN